MDDGSNVVPIKPVAEAVYYEAKLSAEQWAAIEAGIVEVEPGVYKPTAKPRTREHMLQVGAIRKRKRADRIARGENPSGRGRLKPITEKEIRDRALDRAADLFADARALAVNKLIDQVSHKDPAVAQRAAVKILEYTDGKPNQPVTAHTENVTRVVYETAALPAETFLPGFGLGLADDDAA